MKDTGRANATDVLWSIEDPTEANYDLALDVDGNRVFSIQSVFVYSIHHHV